MISLVQLQSFHAVYVHGTTVSAAAYLSRSQSQVSADLRALENELGQQLFLRSGGRLWPTHAADNVLNRAERVFEAHQQLARLGVGRGDNETLVIGAPRSLSMTLLPQLAQRLRVEFPKLTLTLKFNAYAELVTAVAEGRMDQAIVKLPLSDSRIRVRFLEDASLMVVMPKDDDLASQEEISPMDLGQRHLIRTGDQSPAWQAVSMAFAQADKRPNSKLSVEGIGPICQLVSKGEGLAIVNGLMAAGYLSSLGLVMRPFSPRTVERFALISNIASTRGVTIEDTKRILHSFR